MDNKYNNISNLLPFPTAKNARSQEKSTSLLLTFNVNSANKIKKSNTASTVMNVNCLTYAFHVF